MGNEKLKNRQRCSPLVAQVVADVALVQQKPLEQCQKQGVGETTADCDAGELGLTMLAHYTGLLQVTNKNTFKYKQ